MKEGDIILIALPQADGRFKNRPALLLKRRPPFNDWLICGVSSQLHQRVPDFDELVMQADGDFPSSGLISDAVIRLGFLAVTPGRGILGVIGSIATDRHLRLRRRLSNHLRP